IKTRALTLVGLLSLAAAALAPAQPALANGPEGGGSPGTFLTVTPSDNLGSPATVSVSGTGYKPSFTTGFIEQCGVQPGLTLEDCVDLTTFTTDSNGAFLPVQVQVNATFQPAGAVPAINCRTTTCSVFASTDEKNAHHHLSFTGNVTHRVADFDGDGD